MLLRTLMLTAGVSGLGFAAVALGAAAVAQDGAAADAHTHGSPLYQRAVELYKTQGPPEVLFEAQLERLVELTPTCVEIAGAPGELLAWDAFERRPAEGGVPGGYTLHYFAYVAVDVAADGVRSYREASETATAWLALAPGALTGGGSIAVPPAGEGETAADRLARAESLQAGPFDPRVAAVLERLGEPDAVYERYSGREVLDDEYAIKTHYKRLYASETSPLALLTWPRFHEGVLHPSWADYEAAYTTADGVRTYRPVRQVTLDSATWIYADEGLMVRIPRDGVAALHEAPIGPEEQRALASSTLNDPERYARLQDALRPRSLLGDAVHVLLELQAEVESDR